MSDDPGLPGRVRRVGARDQKHKIDAPSSLIPPEPAAGPPPVLLQEPPVPESSTEPIPNRPRRQPVRVAARRRRSWPYNLAALFFLLLAGGACAYFAAVWFNPYGALNPFPPLTPLPVVVSMTPTVTLIPTATDTPTPPPTLTPSLTPTPEPAQPPTPTEPPEAATGANSFAPVESGGRNVIFIANLESRGGCAWQSVAGTVTDVSGSPLNDYRVRVLGDGIDATTTSGSAPGYGPGGFEVQLGSQAVEGQVAVQLLDPAGSPVSEVVTVPTSARCDWNISIIRFAQLSVP